MKSNHVKDCVYKKCLCCNIQKEISKFHFRRERLTYQGNCKKCRNTQRSNWDKRNKGTRNEKEKIRRKNDEYRKKEREYRARTKDKVKLSNKKYRDRNREKANQSSLNHYFNNKEKILKKRKDNPVLKMRIRCSNMVRIALNAVGKQKNGSCLKFFPFTMQELKEHLESQFTWHTWENHGKTSDTPRTSWHLDHIIPQSALPYSSMNCENFRICWNLRNLRPYDSYHNIRKGNRLDYEE